jgi:hypothetical protein
MGEEVFTPRARQEAGRDHPRRLRPQELPIIKDEQVDPRNTGLERTELVFASFLINVLYNSVFLDQSVAVHNESTFLRSGSLHIMHREKEYCRIISDVR